MAATVISLGVDYSALRISAASVKRDGYAFAHRYLDFPGQRWPALDSGEVADFENNGVQLEAIFERRTNDPAGGFHAGYQLGTEAVIAAMNCTLPLGTTIYMCSDAWLSNNGITIDTAMSFLDGAAGPIKDAGYKLGAYGFADFVFEAQAGGHAERYWLCGARIPDEYVPDWLDVYQYNNGRIAIDGVDCDLNYRYRPIDRGDDVSWSEILTLTNTDGSIESHEAREWFVHMARRIARLEIEMDKYTTTTNYKGEQVLTKDVISATEGKQVKLDAKLDGIATGTGHPVEEIALAAAKATVAELKKEGN